MQYKTIAISSFAGGLNKDPNPDMIGDTQASILTDAYPRYSRSLCSRRFRVKQNAVVLGAEIHGVSQYLSSGGIPLMMSKAGVRLFDSLTEVAASLSSNGLMSGVSLNQKFYLIDEENAKKYNRATGALSKWGMDRPTSIPTLTLGAAGALNGTYTYKVTYLFGDAESLPSDESLEITAANQQVQLTNIPCSPDSQCTGRNIYRFGGTTAVYNLVTSIMDNTTIGYVDNQADTNLSVELTCENNGPPPLTCKFLIQHFLRLYMGGDTTPGRENWLWHSEDFGADLDAIEYWGPYPYENFIQIGDAQKITSALSMFRTMIVWKENEIWVCEGTVPNEMFVTQSKSKRGTPAPLGVGFYQQPVFPAWDGVFSFDGRQEQTMVEFSDPLFDTEINKNYLYRAVASVWRGKYHLAYPEIGHTTPNKILVIDLQEKGARYILDFPASSFAIDSKGELWAGDSSGWIRKLEQPVNTDEEVLSFVYRSKKFALSDTPGDVGGLATIFFSAKTDGFPAVLRIYLDGICVLEKGFNSTNVTFFRQKLPARFGRDVQVEFEYNGDGEFRVVPPIVINPVEGMV